MDGGLEALAGISPKSPNNSIITKESQNSKCKIQNSVPPKSWVECHDDLICAAERGVPALHLRSKLPFFIHCTLQVTCTMNDGKYLDFFPVRQITINNSVVAVDHLAKPV